MSSSSQYESPHYKNHPITRMSMRVVVVEIEFTKVDSGKHKTNPVAEALWSKKTIYLKNMKGTKLISPYFWRIWSCLILLSSSLNKTKNYND